MTDCPRAGLIDDTDGTLDHLIVQLCTAGMAKGQGPSPNFGMDKWYNSILVAQEKCGRLKPPV